MVHGERQAPQGTTRGLTAAQEQIVFSNPTWRVFEYRRRDDWEVAVEIGDDALDTYVGYGPSVRVSFDDVLAQIRAAGIPVLVDETINDLRGGQRIKHALDQADDSRRR